MVRTYDIMESISSFSCIVCAGTPRILSEIEVDMIKLEGNGPIDLRRLGAIRIYQVMLNNFLLRYLYY